MLFGTGDGKHEGHDGQHESADQPILLHGGPHRSDRQTATDLTVLPITDGYAVVVDCEAMHQPDGQWIRDVLADGGAMLQLGSDVFSLVNPRLETFGAACARLGYWIDGLPPITPGMCLLVMDKDHRCPGTCRRRNRPQRCGRCLAQCVTTGRQTPS